MESTGTDAEPATDAVEGESGRSDGGPDGADGARESEAVPAVADQLDMLSARIDRLDQQLEDQSTSGGVELDPDLVHKVAHACLQSEAISEDEELRILEELLASDD